MEEKRVCSKCGFLKEATEFPFRNKVKGTRHSYCLPCGRSLSKNHYKNNVPYYVRKAHLRRKELLDGINEKLFDYLEHHSCVDCGESDPVVLEFDHVRGEKSYNVSAMGWLVLAWDSLLKEIEKCEVRCANCHRRKTAERRGSYRYKRRLDSLAESKDHLSQ
jgi:hypothetical protein